jgi:dihydroxyacetone kinase-like predicted kinase
VAVAADDGDILMALKYAASLSSSNVVALESSSVVSLIEMLMAMPLNADIDRTAAGMERALGSLRFFLVARAVRTVRHGDGPEVRKGEFFVLHQDEIAVVGDSPFSVVAQALQKLLEHETLVTVYRGKPAGKKDRLCEVLGQKLPGVEIEEYHGGQSRYHYIVTME